MNIIDGLQSKNREEAYQLLLLLEKESVGSNALYPCFEEFVQLTKSKSSFVQIRGFRLACAQAPWDTEGKLDRDLDQLLSLLDGGKPIAVRQCLAALGTVAEHKPALRERIRAKLDEMDLSRYKDTMAPLIQKDMDALRQRMA